MEDNKELEKMVDNLFEADTLDNPSMGFTHQVMAKIEALRNERFKFRPLLPKWVFVLLGAMTTVFVWYVLQTGESNTSKPNYWDQVDVSGYILELFNQFNFSSSMGYSLLVIGFMICGQAFLLTKYFNKRFA